MRTYPSRLELYKELIPPDSRVLEIGVWCGGNAVQMLALGNPSRLDLVEPWCEPNKHNSHKPHQGRMMHAVGRLADGIADHRVVIHVGFSAGVLTVFPEDFFSFCYIDGAHDTESVAIDLELCARTARYDGVIAGHDFNRPSVANAVNEFCSRTKWQLIATTAERDDPISFVLMRSGHISQLPPNPKALT